MYAEHSHEHASEKGHGKKPASPLELPDPAKPAAGVVTESTPLLIPSPSLSSQASTPRQRAGSSSSLYGHPAHTRASIVAAGQEAQWSQAKPVRQRIRSDDEGVVRSAPVSGAFAGPRGIIAQLGDGASDEQGSVQIIVHNDTPEEEEDCEPPMGDTEGPYAHAHPVTPYEAGHDEHDHDHAHEHGHSKSHSHGHGHSHGSMNMRALVLHVLGDALGNVGVIATGLIIWLSDWRGKYYCDPIISLVITVIIFSSALPLGTSQLASSPFNFIV